MLHTQARDSIHLISSSPTPFGSTIACVPNVAHFNERQIANALIETGNPALYPGFYLLALCRACSTTWRCKKVAVEGVDCIGVGRTDIAIADVLADDGTFLN